MKKVDIVILGGGAGGLNVASVASQLGLATILIEKANRLGGDCLHYGCVPSKTLIHSAKVAQLIKTADQFGLSKQQCDVDLAKVNARVREVIEHIQQHDDPKRFESYGCEVIFGSGKFLNENTVQVNGEVIKAKKFIIATGSRPIIPALPFIENIPYYTNESIFEAAQLPKHLVILGSGAIGLEMAQAYRRLGSQITIIEKHEKLLPKIDRDITDQLQTVLMYEGIRFYFSTAIKGCKKIGANIIFDCSSKLHGDIEVTGNVLLIATGRTPNIETLNLDKAGVNVDNRNGIIIDKKCCTTNKRIYAIGDVTNTPYKFTHTAEYHAGVVIANAIFKFPKKLNNDYIPAVIYTDPELAQIGLDENTAKQRGMKIKIIRFALAEIDRAITSRQTAGEIKLVISCGYIVGATLLGEHAGELIAEIVLAMQAKIPLRKVVDTIHAYPTLAQIVKRAGGQYYAPKLFSQLSKRWARWAV